MDTTTAAGAVPGTQAQQQRVFETSHLDVAREFLIAALGTSLRMKGTEQSRLMRHARFDFGSFCVDDVTLPLETGFDVDPLGCLAVVEPRTGWVEHRWDGGSGRAGPGEIAALSPPDRPFTALTHQLDFGSIVLGQTVLGHNALLAEGQSPDSLRFTGMRPASAGLANRWRDTVAHVRDVLAARPDAMREPLVVGEMARCLAESALATFPNTGAPEPTSRDGSDATPGAVRRAVAFIEEHAHTDITVTDIAGAARVSPYALRTAFARHHARSPLGCMRGVRLDRAHFDLLGADADADADADTDANNRATVAAVAARWGFPEPGRFAAFYRDVYGVSPYDTLAL
ncbi:helix-turn-helix domain-containing protein [Streptomyces ovatisporus]|uniref:Helix-turn-helix domain-containing protein n=1 Tax=Streptomyces ovatisporus TaxID=1128682 RepID=A0ABV9A6H8_9ACTN